MPPAPCPENEIDRLRALRSLRVLDTDPEQGFDELTALASELLGMPTALVSLVDEHRQWFKSRVGTDVCETDRSESVCAYVIQQAEPLVIEDLTLDARTSDNPLVTGEPGLRFYAGAPIVLSSGEAVGALCVLDTRPRSVNAQGVRTLERLASLCATLLEARREAELRHAAEGELRSIRDASPMAVMHLEPVRDARTRVTDFRILDANQTTARILRMPQEVLPGSTLLQRMPGLAEEQNGWVMRMLRDAASSRDPGQIESDYDDGRVNACLRWHAVSLDDGLVVTVEDITAVRTAQRQVHAHEKLMRQFVEHTPVPVAMLDTEMRYLVAADRWYSEYDLEQDDLTGMHHYEVFPDLSEEWKQIHRRVLEGETLSSERDRYVRPDGSVQWLRWQMYPWYDDDGEIGGMIVFTEDITARVEQDLIIERSHDLLDQTQSLTGVGGWSVDLTSKQLHWTDQTFAIHGLERCDGGPDIAQAIEHYAPEHQEMVRSALETAIANGEAFDFEAEIIRRDGARVPVRSVGQPVVQRGNVVRVVGAFQDLSKVRADQEQRDRTLAMLRAMSEGTADLIFVKDLEGRFLFLNPAMAAFCGRPEPEILGRLDTEVMPKAIADMCREGDHDAIQSDQIVSIDEEIPTPEGVRYFKTTKQPYRLSDGRIVGVITLCHDVTEIRAQEDERRRLTEIIQAITDASSDVIFVKDRSGHLIFCNPAYAEAMGRPMDELIGTSDYTHMDEETSEEVRQTDEIVLRTGEPIRVEEHVTLEGLGTGERIFESEKHPYRLPDGSTGGVIGVCRDITEIRAAMDEAQRSRQRLNFALSAAGVGYWDHDITTDEVYYADTWYTMLGYKPGELPMTLGSFWNDLLHPDDREQVRAAHDEYLSGRADSYDTHVRLRRKDGSWHAVRNIGSIIERSEVGNPMRIVGVHVDVDQQQRAQVRLETALVAANEGLWEWSIPDNSCYFDDMWYRLLGYEPGELPMEFESWEAICHPDDLEMAKLALGRYLTGETPTYAFEHRLRTKQGVWKWILGTGRITERDEEGRPMRLVGVNLDIDDRMYSAETLERALGEAEAANTAKSQFLANMSHEIRTPMTAILGYAELMASDEEIGRDQDRMRETAGIIQRNGEHLLAIINDILDISKIDAGKMTIEAVRTDPLEIIRDVHELLRGRAIRKGLRYELQQRDPLPDAIVTDPVRIRQILMNLVQNAIKFTESGSVILRVESEADPASLWVSVIDTGMGMSEDQENKLFAAFQQGDDSMARRFGGTGLGLAISKHLAGLMLGDLTVTSRPGKGSVFTLELPMELAEGAAWHEPGNHPDSQPGTPAEQHAAIERSLAGARILLVEDGPDNQRLISHHLSKAGASVMIADNGEEGMQRIGAANRAGDPFDLVLMDMQMPIMDGYAATRALRERGETVPIIALTAHAMTGDRERCLEAGCNDYKTKPIGKQCLLEACSRWRLVRRRAA